MRAFARAAEKLGDESVWVDRDGAEREVVADFFADRLLTDEAAIRAVCEYQPTTARGIRDYIKKLLNKLGGKQSTLEKAVEMYNKALKDVAAKAQAEAQSRLKLKSAPEAKAQGSGLRLGGERQTSSRQWSVSEAEYDPETASIKQQLLNSQDILNSMDVVASAQVPTRFEKKETAADWATKLLKSAGYAIDRQNFGKIIFNEDDIKNAVNYADTDAEKAAIAVLPYVLKRGIQIGEHTNHKARNKQTVTFGAPVELNGTRGNMAVVVNRNGNHYYAHRILLPDGSVFKFSDIKEDTARESSRGVTENGSHAKTTSAASGKRITQDDGKSKREWSADLDEDTYNRRALVSEDTVDKWLKDYASKSTPKYAQAYITRMSPERFLDLTTSRMGRLTIESQTEKLDRDKLVKVTQEQPLHLEISGGEVTGHEGRHRANALARAGIDSIPVLVFDYSNKYSKEITPEMEVQGQDFGSSRSYATVTLRDLTPLNYENRDKIIQDYGTKTSMERMQEKYNNRKTVQFSVDSDDEYRETAGTPALEKLGIRLAGSKGKYHLAEQLLERDKAAKELMRATKKAEKKLNATKAEKEFAAGIYEEREQDRRGADR